MNTPFYDKDIREPDFFYIGTPLLIVYESHFEYRVIREFSTTYHTVVAVFISLFYLFVVVLVCFYYHYCFFRIVNRWIWSWFVRFWKCVSRKSCFSKQKKKYIENYSRTTHPEYYQKRSYFVIKYLIRVIQWLNSMNFIYQLKGVIKFSF